MTRAPLLRDRLDATAGPVVAARYAHTPGTRVCATPVAHVHAVLSFYVGGSAHVEQGGAWTVREGDVLLVPAGAPHRTLARDRPELWGLALSAPCFASSGAAALLEPFERVRDGASAVVSIPGARQAYLATLFAELAEVSGAPRGANDAVTRSLLTLILAEVERASGAHAPRAPGGGVVVEALRYIERHCLGRLTPEQVAAAIGRSPTYVTAALTRATGRSAGAWITSGRMAEARRLLLSSDEHVDIIGERVGYADVTHFIRTFRREHGHTPAAWRAARRAPALTGGRAARAPSTVRRSPPLP